MYIVIDYNFLERSNGEIIYLYNNEVLKMLFSFSFCKVKLNVLVLKFRKYCDF